MVSKKKSPNPVSIVEWEDAVHMVENTQLEVLNNPPEIVETYGKVVLRNKSYLLVMTHNSKGDYNDYMKIPIKLVRRIDGKEIR